VGPDQLKELEASNPHLARIVWLAKEFIRLTEATKQPGLTEASIRELNAAKRQAADYYDALKAALAGEEVEQGGLLDG